MIKRTNAPSASQLSAEEETLLIRKAASGEANAFARLYDFYVDEVYRFIFFRVSNEQIAEDLTSQLFVKVWDKLDSYEPRGVRFGAWLFQIARNMVIDYYRTRKETVALEDGALTKPDPQANVAKNVEKKLEGERMRAMLEHLTDDQREVITLKFIDGFSTNEIAEVMKKKPGAIRALQMRGLQQLAKIMDGEPW